jgi:general secretion pathway protein D
VSAPQANSTSSIDSPSFSRRSINTQVTVQDGDTVAIGGIINESNTFASAGIPVLHKIPILGSAFGSRSYSKERSELIIFMTSRVIYDTNQIMDASEEIRSRLKQLRKEVRE